MSIRHIWLPDRLSVRQMSLTRPIENTALPAPITDSLMAADILNLLK
jgi:hypothetical protein